MLISSALPAAAAPLVLVKDGRPNATIILQPDAQAPMQQAATDLQHYIQKISGIQLPLKTDGKDVPGITLNVGKTATVRDSDFPDSTLNPETYVITQRGEKVYFEGNYPSPTAFAVYAFLQDQLGVRWFAPGDDWEYVPQNGDKSTFTVDVKSVVSVPGTSPRLWSGHGWTQDWKDWCLRNKVVTSEKVPWRNFQNNIYKIFPPSKYAKTHPEYYPLIDGKRWIPSSDTYRYWWPATGNPDVQRITAEYIHQWFKENPEQDTFSLGMDDISYVSDDPLSNAMDGSVDDYQKREFSSRFYKFINIIARQVKKTDPEKYIGMLIYRNVVKPPHDVPKMEDNVFGYIADGSVAQWYQDGKKEEWISNTREWARKMKHLSRYEYLGIGTFAPRYFPHQMAEMMEIDHSLGFEGSYVEFKTMLPQTAPMIWAFAQKQWNPALNIDDLLDEFFTKAFGQSAPSVEKYFSLMEKSWNTQRPGHDGWVFRNIVHQATSVSPEAIDEGMDLLNQAYDHADSPLIKRRVAIIRDGLTYAAYSIKEYALSQQLATIQINDEFAAQEAIKKVRALASLMEKQQAFWPEAIKRNDILGESLAGMKKLGILQTNTVPLENPAIPGFLRITQWYRQNQPEKADAILHQLIDCLPPSNIRDSINAYHWVSLNSSKSLLKNGSFDEVTNDQNNQPPAGWSDWNRYGQARYLQVPGRNGNGCLVQTNTAIYEKATIMQEIKATPGERFLGIIWVKLPDSTFAGDATISLRFRNKKGWIAGEEGSVASNPIPITEWQPVIITATVPADATAISFNFDTTNGAAIFDDAVLYRILVP